MNLFKKDVHMVDERIISTRNKIYKEAFGLAITLCFASIVVKYAAHGIKSDLVLTELVVIVVSGLYCLIRRVMLGLYSDEVEMHDRTNRLPLTGKNIIIGLGAGVAIALFFGIRNASLYGSDVNRLKYFVVVFFAALMIYLPLFIALLVISDLLARKASKKIAEKEEE